MDSLDDGVLFEILLRMPSKLLHRSKFTNRRWLSMISSPMFTRARLTRSLQESTPPQFLLLDRCTESPGSLNIKEVVNGGRKEDVCRDIDCPSLYPRGDSYLGHTVLGSCHGLVCLQREEVIFLCNPTTMESRKLPQHPHSGQTEYYTGACGLGYDVIHDDYKVLISSNHAGDPGYTFHVFSLKSNSWKSIGKFDDIAPPLPSRAVHANGFLHWFDSRWDGPGAHIVSFNIATEKFYEGMLPMPTFKPHHGFTRLTATEEGSLVAYRNYCDLGMAEVLIMKDCCAPNTTWTKLCDFSYKPLKDYPEWARESCLFPFIKDGKIVVATIAPRHGLMAIMYGSAEDSLETVRLPFHDDSCCLLSDMVVYVETLVSLEATGEARGLKRKRL